MLQPRIPARRPALDQLTTSLSALCLHQVRHASHASQGRANGPSDSAGRRLGLKKGQTEHVIPGNIIFKQRGTKWHPGENVGIGKDHTIYSLVDGYVRYYRDPALHPKRRYIGVALANTGKESILPTPKNAPTRRRVGMVSVPMKATATEVDAAERLEGHVTAGSMPAAAGTVGGAAKPPPIMRYKGYRIANVQLAKDAVDNQVQVRPFDKRDRWKAWRVRVQKFKNKRAKRATAAVAKKSAGKVKGGTKRPVRAGGNVKGKR